MNGKVDWMRAVLAGTLLLSFQLALGALFKFEVPQTNRDMVIYMLGQLSGMVTTALAFYFATSKSSHDKDKLLAGMASAPTATGKPDDPVHVVPDSPEGEP